MFVLILWFIPYYDGNWNPISLAFYGVLAIGLLLELRKKLKQARVEHEDEVEFTEVVSRVKRLNSTREIPCIEVESKEISLSRSERS